MPLFWLSLAYICGVWLGQALSMSPVGWYLVGGLAVPLLVLPVIVRHLVVDRSGSVRKFISQMNPRTLQGIFRPVNRLRGIRLGIAFPWLVIILCLGAVRYHASLPVLEANSLVNFNDLDDPLLLEGTVVTAPEQRDGYINLVVEASSLRLPGSVIDLVVQGQVLARLDTGKEWRYGDRVRLEGWVNTPVDEETFSYRQYLARRGIFSQILVKHSVKLDQDRANPLLTALYALRARSLEILYQIYPDPEASLLAGILLGIEQGIPDEVNKAFQVTGTTHIIAISGFNMTLLVGLFSIMFTRLFGRWRGALIAVIGIGLYTLLVGAQAAVVRAAVMGGLSVLAAQVGRRQHGLNSLVFTCAVMAGFQPQVLWDIGFQLSVAATLGLVLYGDTWPRALENRLVRFLPQDLARKITGPIAEYFLLTLAAQLMTLPVLVYHFQRISLVSLLVNPLILPIQPLVMVVGGLSLLAGWTWLPAGALIGKAGWVLAALTIRLVEAFASLPASEILLPAVALGWVGLFYIVLLGWTFLAKKASQVLMRVRPGFGLGILAVLVIHVWRLAWAAPDGLLHITVLDTNTDTRSGEALLIRSPSGKFILVNGGPSTLRLSDALGRRLGSSGGNLDTLIVAGVDANQLQALPEILPRYSPGFTVYTGDLQATYVSRQVYASIRGQDENHHRALPGMSLDLGDGAEIRFLDTSRRGAVLALEWKSFRALFPLGMDFDNLEELQARKDIHPVTALLLADSGYAPLNPPEWVAALNPQVILLSVAARDATGLPSSQVLDALKAYTILRTDRDGWIELSTDGEQMWVEVEK